MVRSVSFQGLSGPDSDGLYARRWEVVNGARGGGGEAPVQPRRVSPDGRGRHPRADGSRRADPRRDRQDVAHRQAPRGVRQEPRPAPRLAPGGPGDRLRPESRGALGRYRARAGPRRSPPALVQARRARRGGRPLADRGRGDVATLRPGNQASALRRGGDAGILGRRLRRRDGRGASRADAHRLPRSHRRRRGWLVEPARLSRRLARPRGDLFVMGAPTWPRYPQRSERPGEAVAPLYNTTL